MAMSWIRLFTWVVAVWMCSSEVAVAQTDREVVIFVYHRFGDDRFPSTNVPLADFIAHLEYLKNNGYKVMTLSAVAKYLAQPGPWEKAAAITIDDGYESFYRNGLPLLKKFGFPATLFINTETVGAGSYMDWPQLAECQKAGVEIGNHSHSHAYFLNQPEESRYSQFRDDLMAAQSLIGQNLGQRPAVFAYPYGELDSRMRDVVASLGFLTAAAQNSGVAYAGSDMMRLPRFPMSSAYSAPEKFTAKAKMRALKISGNLPEPSVLSSQQLKPKLEVAVESQSLRLSQMQCFVQGASCDLGKTEQGGLVNVTVTPSKPLTARRTLYTITVPDDQGSWHWYSHLWVNPAVK